MQEKIKILYLIDRLWSGGTENQLLMITDNLNQEMFKTTIGVIIQDTEKDLKPIHTPVVNFNLSGLPIIKNINLIRRIRRFIIENNIDIVQTQFPVSTIYGTVSILFLRKKPYLIGTRRNLYHWIKEEPWNFKMVRFCNYWTDKILVNSYCVMNTCMAIEKVKPDRLTLIQNGVEIGKLNQVSPEEAKVKIGLEGKGPIIGVVANWRPIKGLVPFLRAAALVKSKIKTAYFVLMGMGPQKEELINLTHMLELDNCVLFLENVHLPNEIIPAFDIAVQPSLSESFSNVILEYMAAGKPIVASDVGDASNIIENGKDGIVVQPNDPEVLASAIVYLHENKEIAQALSDSAKEKVIMKWSSEKILNQYIELYRSITQQNSLR